MIQFRWVVFSLFGAAVFSSLGLADEKKPVPTEKKSGTVTGAVVAKDKNWIEVKADGEEKARRYVPRWVGNAGGGFDKTTLKQFADLKIGSRIRLEWEFEERARAVKIEVLKEATKKDK